MNPPQRMMHRSTAGIALVFGLATAASSLRAEEPVDFQRDIRPLLSDRCFQCHGPAEKNRKAGLRLDRREGAFSEHEGKTAIVPGDPDASELVRRIGATDPKERMPPQSSGKSLNDEEIALLERWVREGANWEEHWSFVAPARPALPPVRNQAWVKNPVDRFILSRLEREGLEPSEEADRRTLIRRVTFDLTGLPPTRDEVDAFLADQRPDAYDRLVDRLLASPRYGEHMARYWLDAARYGDTHGLHLDNVRIMWPYRDWVVNAYNTNVPFDRFTVEQVAGDLLPDATLDQQIASGFNRCNVTTSEGGAIDEEFYVRYAVDRVETTSTVWMGLTAGCARCHDHKFDPITRRDFYQLFAFFNNITEKAMDGNAPAPPPVVKVPLPGDEEKLAEVRASLATVREAIGERSKGAESDFQNWLAKAEKNRGKGPELPAGELAHFPLDGSMLDAAHTERSGTSQGKVSFIEGRFGQALTLTDGYVDAGDICDFEADRPFSYGAWIKTPGNVTGSPFARMDTQNDFRGWDLYIVGRKVAMHLIHRWSDDALKVTTKEDVLEPNQWHHVFVTYDGSRSAGGVAIWIDGKRREHDVNVDALRGSTKSYVSFHIGQRRTDSRFTGGSVDDIRVYPRALSAAEITALAGTDPIGPLLAIPAAERTAEANAKLRQYYLSEIDGPYRELRSQAAALESTEREILGRSATTLVMHERDERKQTFMLERGEYDRPTEPVEPGTPAMLPSFPKDQPRNRLGLARWLVEPENPLTARVAVNRYWQRVFGVGIVKTQEDFGSQGEPPTHPLLLDWLATEFIRRGWNVKEMQRLLVTSATYRQTSSARPELIARDPQNRLLARGPRFRLDGEMLRDQALAVSGLLVDEEGGMSVKPPQPAGLWEAVGYTSSNTAKFSPDTGDKVFRRSVYTFWKRTSAPPLLSIFDAPSREACRVRRERTNTPLQALALMNEQQFVEAARYFAARAMRSAEDGEDRAAWLYEMATARKADTTVLGELQSAWHDFHEAYAANPAAAEAFVKVGTTPPPADLDPVELASWTLVANVVLNLDETINKN